ncbi:Hypothetical protein UVM_LOCUS31, partial [uncultured virus]
VDVTDNDLRYFLVNHTRLEHVALGTDGGYDDERDLWCCQRMYVIGWLLRLGEENGWRSTDDIAILDAEELPKCSREQVYAQSTNAQTVFRASS